MSVQRRINTRNLRSYFPVKKSTNLCLTKGSADSLTNAAITSKLSAVHSTTVLNGETSKEISKVNVVNRNNSESHLLKKVQDDRMQNSKFSTLNNEEQHYVVPNANYRGENSEKDTAPLNIPRKRKACSNTEEVNDVNPLKMVKLDSVSCNVSSIREQHLKSSNVDTNLNDTRCIKITESKSVAAKVMKAKLLNPENSNILKQVLESKKRIEQAKEELTQHRAEDKKITSAQLTEPTVECEPKKENSELTLPAYKKFHSLASSDSTSTLILPLKYKVLSEMFRCVDMAVGMIYNRKEISTFTKVKAAVQEMLRRAFELRHLGQIKTVFPTAFYFQQEKLPLRGIFSNATDYHLTIMQNFQCFSQAQSNVEDISGYENNLKNTSVIKPSFLVTRRKFFHNQLLDLVKKYHNEFLAAQTVPIIVDSNKLIRWHPQFRIDEVPDIVPSELPLPEDSQKVTTAKEVLDKIKGLYSTKLDIALENIISNTTTDTTQKVTETKNDGALKGIPLTLLEKIRAKEAAKIREEMTRNPTVDKRLKMISRLPEISRILRNLFIAEKKVAILTPHVISKLMESYNGSLSEGEMEEHLNLLTELVPEWATMIQIKKGTFLKLTKTVSFNVVTTKLENALQNAKH